MRIFTIIFTVLYLVVSVGVTMSGHFCGGHLTKYSLAEPGKHLECCCKGAPMKPGCCENKSLTLKSESKHSPASSLQIQRSIHAISVMTASLQNIVSVDIFNISGMEMRQPPDIPDCPIHIRNRILLI